MTAPNPTSLALGDDGEDHPRRLLLIGKHLVAYGGDHGTISLVSNADDAKVVRNFDDAVRALAVSHDLLRVAVGFDDGSTQIFAYEKSALDDNELHPFLHNGGATNDDTMDESQDFLSQSDGLAPITTTSKEGESFFLGPRFDAPARHLQFDPRSYHLAIATEAGLCIVDVTTSKSLETRYLQESVEKEHDSCGIRGVSYRKTLDGKVMLATLAMDGRLCVWDVTAPNQDPLLDYELVLRDSHKCVTQTDVGEINGANAFDRSCLPVFGRDFLALPGLTDVQLRRVGSSLKEQSFLSSVGGQGHVDTIVALAFSPDNRYLITSGRDGRVVLWELDPNNDDGSCGSFVAQIGHYDSIPTHMIWNKDDQGETLYIASANGSLCTIRGRDKIVPTSITSGSSSEIQESDETSAKANNNVNNAPKESRHKRIANKSTAFGESDDDDDDNTIAFNKEDEIDAQVPKNKGEKKTSFVVDEAEEEDDDELVGVDAAPTVGDKNDDLESEATGEDDLLPLGNDEDDFDHNDDYEVDADHSRVTFGRRDGYMKLPEPQPAFAPSSTPLDLTRRIMCWNHIGTVSLLRGEDDMTLNTVDIEFTDGATRRPVSFTDNMNFILGSLGEDGGIFATDLADDDMDGVGDDVVGDLVEGLHMSERTKALVRRSHRKRMKKAAGDSGKSSGSSVYFHRFNTFGALRDKDWYMTLPDGERAMGCACGEGWAATMTSRRFLRFFSSGGNQGPIVWLKGEPVTIVGRSTFVAVIYHDGSPLPDGTQKLGYALFDGLTARQIALGAVSSISTRSKLTWAGFSNDCSLMVMDSDGMISMLVSMKGTDGSPNESFAWEWSPMLDTVGLRKSADDNFFPITCQDGKLICVPLKGGNEYPDAVRRPVTATLSLRMPLARDTLDTGMQLEEISVRANLALTQKKFLNESLALDAEEKDESEDEYTVLCAQVDKVTLKLYMAIVEAGKLERALDLVERLHLEKSFDIAMTIADRLNHRNLSDRINSVMDRRFPEEDEEQFETLPQIDYTTRDEVEADAESTQVSPDWANERKRTTDDEWEAPKKKKSKTTLAKPSNPFAKRKMESPARPSMSPAKSTPTRPALSRLSTFSAKSREKTKGYKRIL